MDLRLIDWIWHIRGSVALGPGQSGEEAFDRLDPLFRESGTTRERTDGTRLSFAKKDAAAQDKLAVFDKGTLSIESGRDGPMLRYHLISRALLACFLAPLLFLAFAQLTVVIVKYQKDSVAAAHEAKKPEPKKVLPAMNPIDKMLGAPAPEKPKEGEEGGRRGRKPSPTPAYVFAGIFAALYVIGRILEDRLVKARFQKRLLAPA